MSLTEGGKIDSDLYNKITDDERDIFERLLSDARINRLSHVRYNQPEIDFLINKFNILKGEIMAGNDNIELIKDLKVTVLRLVNYNVLKLVMMCLRKKMPENKRSGSQTNTSSILK